MTQEKDLLLKDLCGRLPYKVYINDRGTPHRLVNIYWDGIKFVVNCSPFGTGHGRIGTPLFDGDICYIKPYLRPLSSMTEEEILEFYKIVYDTWYSDSLYYKNEEWITFRASIKNNNLCFMNCIWLSDINKITDYLNKKMFDFRGLIPKDLAISTEVFNPYYN